MSKEILLEELEAVKNCIEMTDHNIRDAKTAKKIVAILNNRIAELEEEVDAAIAAQDNPVEMDVA